MAWFLPQRASLTGHELEPPVQNKWHCNAERQGLQGGEEFFHFLVHALTRLHASDTLLSLLDLSYCI